RVPPETARLVNGARAAGRRVIAVGTTVVRALETVTDAEGVTHPGEGWTRVVVTPERGLRAVNGLLTGFHEPRATHLAMLEALAVLAHRLGEVRIVKVRAGAELIVGARHSDGAAIAADQGQIDGGAAVVMRAMLRVPDVAAARVDAPHHALDGARAISIPDL